MLAAAHPKAILLREKNLGKEEYCRLAEQALAICEAYNTPCILHGFADAAKELGHPALHLPLGMLRTLSQESRRSFQILGASCHSLQEAKEAERLGCSYITFGHVFETDCKPGLPGRGLAFLKEVCKSVSLPVYAIGGISPENFAAVRRVGAAGACIMSGCMQCENASEYLALFQEETP